MAQVVLFQDDLCYCGYDKFIVVINCTAVLSQYLYYNKNLLHGTVALTVSL